MPDREFDVIVVGVGAMGSATVAELAARGLRVLGLERSGVPNDQGSSGGVTRIIRLAYNEDPRYVPLVRRAYERWHALEDRVGERLLITYWRHRRWSAGFALVRGALAACRLHDIPFELLEAPALRARFPGFALPDGMVGVYQADAGFVLSERAIAAYAMTAIDDGAEIHGYETVIDWEPDGDGVVVRTDRGEYRARRLVLSAGAWMAQLAAHRCGPWPCPSARWCCGRSHSGRSGSRWCVSRCSSSTTTAPSGTGFRATASRGSRSAGITTGIRSSTRTGWIVV